MKRSFFFNIFFGYFLLIIFLSSLILFASFTIIRDFHFGALTTRLEHIGATVRNQVIPLIQAEKYADLDALVKRLGNKIDTRLTVIAPDGIVLADSERDPTTMDNHRFRPEIVQAYSGKVGTSLRYSDTVKEEMLYVALPIIVDTTVVSVMRSSLFIRDINLLLDRLKDTIMQIALIMVIVSLGVAYFIARSFSHPIKQLCSVSELVARGDLNAKVVFSQSSNNELRQLAHCFNTMNEQLKKSFNDISRQKDELNSIISAMQEGLVVLNAAGVILFCNISFKEIVGKEEVEQRLYWEVIQETHFNELIRTAIATRANKSGEISLDAKTYICSITFLSKRDEIVAVFHDVTEMKQVETIKKDFVSNVSHELRTPLTAIKGYAETLDDMTTKESKQYASIIRKNTDRLINIVEDLLQLSELEERDTKLNVESIDVKKLLEGLVPLFDHQAKEKKLQLTFDLPKTLPRILADPFKLQQAFINVIDNAIKYTERGSITVHGYEEHPHVIIEISDTGIGIPADQLNRVFERFYVVDPSRSKKLGGTGLGLSIVKHIILLHKGSISIRSSVGTGSTFIITLPKAAF